MSRPPLDPQQIPDDASTGDLAAYVGEDVARLIVLRVAALTGVVTVITGLLSESASDELKAACLAIGGLGLVVLLLAQLFGWRRSRQWIAILVVTLACAALLVTVFLGSRA